MAELVNPLYLEKKTLAAVQKHFKTQGSIQLHAFLSHQVFAALQVFVKELSFKHQLLPAQSSYSSLPAPLSCKTLLRDPDVLLVLRAIVGEKIAIQDIGIRTMTWKDYTLLHDKEQVKPGIDLYLDLTPDWNPSWGGSLIYVDGTGDSLKIPPASNALVIVRRTQRMRSFIQYINHYGKGKYRYILVAQVATKD